MCSVWIDNQPVENDYTLLHILSMSKPYEDENVLSDSDSQVRSNHFRIVII